jgi:hypothetical protein
MEGSAIHVFADISVSTPAEKKKFALIGKRNNPYFIKLSLLSLQGVVFTLKKRTNFRKL